MGARLVLLAPAAGPWARCAELALPSLCVGDPGDTAAGDRNTTSVADTASLHRTCEGEGVQVPGGVYVL